MCSNCQYEASFVTADFDYGFMGKVTTPVVCPEHGIVQADTGLSTPGRGLAGRAQAELPMPHMRARKPSLGSHHLPQVRAARDGLPTHAPPDRLGLGCPAPVMDAAGSVQSLPPALIGESAASLPQSCAPSSLVGTSLSSSSTSATRTTQLTLQGRGRHRPSGRPGDGLRCSPETQSSAESTRVGV